MDWAARRRQTVSIIQSNGTVYTAADGTEYFGVEGDREFAAAEFGIAPAELGDVVVEIAIEDGKALLTDQSHLTDDQGDDVRVNKVRNKRREGKQILECEVID